MRGWITAGHGTCALQLPLDDAQKLVRGPVDIVVYDNVVELALLVELAPRTLESLLDLAALLRRPRPSATLQLVERRRAHEDRHAAGNLPLDRERAGRLEIEERCFPHRPNATDLGPQGADA